MLASLLLPFVPATHALFGVIVRHAQRRGYRVLWVGAVNYIVAATFNALLALSQGPVHLSSRTWQLAVPAGLAYALNFRIINASMRRKGLAVPSAVMQLAVIIPLAFSVLAWGEQPGALQILGIALGLGALTLLATDKAQAAEAPAAPVKTEQMPLLFLSLLFLLQGACSLAPKAFAELAPAGESRLYLTLLFGAAALTFLPEWLGPLRPRRQDVAWGVALGLVNAGTNLLTVYVLEQLPGIIVYPLMTAGTLLITSGLGLLAWREPMGRWGRAGMAVALGAVLLVSLGNS